MMRLLVFLLTIVGLVAAVLLVRSVGLDAVLRAGSAMGIGGFLLFTAYWLLMLVILGAAWHAATPGVPLRRLPLFVWGRTVREAASDVLPFSQLGGLVLGARTLAARGLPEPLLHASMIVDLTTEMAGQLVLTLAGVAVLAMTLSGGGHPDVLPVVLGGLALTIAIMLGFALAQGPALDLIGRIGGGMLPGSVAAMRAVREALDGIYAQRARVVLSFAINLVAWVASAAAAWIALRLMGANPPLWAVITIESLVFATRSVAFLVPAAIGVQEGAYLLIGPVFGLDPGLGLALSLVKRARDVALGVPVLLIWQASEARGLLRRRAVV